MPLMFIVFGDMTDSFVNLGKYGNCFKLPTKDPLNFNDVYYADVSEYPPLGCENNIPINNTLLPDPESHPLMCFNTTKCEKDLNETSLEVMQGLKESGPSLGFFIFIHHIVYINISFTNMYIGRYEKNLRGFFFDLVMIRTF